jgi:hypothetical protein
MIDTRPISKEMLNEPIIIETDESIDFSRARAIADMKAKESAKIPMLLAWYDKKTGRHSPNIICGCGTKPSWLEYAQSRGGNISIDINKLQFVFVYRDAGV